MAGRPKKQARERAKKGDIHARMALQELKQVENEQQFLELIRVQPLYFLRGVAEWRDLPFPSPQVRQGILAAMMAGRSVEQIAGMLGRSVEELHEHYADEIAHGETAILADAMTTAIGAAIMGDPKMLLPLLRAKAGLVEPKDQLDTSTASPAQIAEQSAALVGRIIDLVDRTRRQDGAIDVTPKEIE